MDRQALLDLLDYDLWANQQWLPILDSTPNPEDARKAYKHLLGCYIGWLSSVSEVPDVDDEGMDFERDTERFNSLWRAEIMARDPLESVILNLRSGEVTLPLWHVLHHVMNHATYHRGHLRTLCVAWGVADFPETDSIAYWVKRARENSALQA